MLLYALASDPTTPPQTIRALAAAVTPATGPRTRTAVACHPNLDHAHGNPLVYTLDAAGLRAALPPAARQQARAFSPYPELALFVTHGIGATREDIAVYLDTERAPNGRMTIAVAEAVATHPGADERQAERAITRLLIRDLPPTASWDRLVTAATRHPAQLAAFAEAAVVHHVADELRIYAAFAATGGDPYTLRIEELLDRKPQPGKQMRPWSRVVTAAGDPSVAAIALGSAANDLAAVGAVLCDLNLPRAVRLRALHVAFTELSAVQRAKAGVGGQLRSLLNDAPVGYVTAVALAKDATLPELTQALCRADLPTDALAAASARLERLHPYRRVTGARLADRRAAALAAQMLAVHPNTAADDRASSVGLAHLYASDASELQLLRMLEGVDLDLIETDPAAAGAHLRLADLHAMHPSNQPGELLLPLVRAALAVRRADLARPDFASALTTLERTFPGTLGELLDTVGAMTQ